MPLVDISAVPHDWLYPASLSAASQIQREMARRVVREDALGPVSALAGVDTSMKWRDSAGPIHAAIVLLDWPALTLRASAALSAPSPIPYVPGYLGFRECPSLVGAYGQLPALPDLIFVDGHGISHPRGLGIASHLGVLLDRPTIGVAKSILIGEPAGPLGDEPGDRTPLVWKGQTIAMVLRTRRRARPLYISTGHRIALEAAVEWVLQATRGYRLPEPTRLAHEAANAHRRRQLALETDTASPGPPSSDGPDL